MADLTPYDIGPDCFPSGEPFRNVFPRNCGHRWLRLPVVDFSLTYQCQECEWALRVGMGPPGLTLEDRDRLFEAEHGGIVIGTAA